MDPLLGAVDGSYCQAEGVSSQSRSFMLVYSCLPSNSTSFVFLDLTDCGNKPTVNVVSISYHFNPDITDPTISPIVQRECTEIGKLSLTGMTFVYSSGDSGVAGFDNLCLDDKGNQIPGVSGTRFNPSFPGGCPYVTSVGATQVVPGNKVTDRESAVFQRFPSGGGFSNVFPRADFQKVAVAGYLERFSPGYAPDLFNASGRAFPDVSANGLNYSVATHGALSLISGTSASAPTVASILSAINDARLAIGKKPIGWVNPAVRRVCGD